MIPANGKGGANERRHLDDVHGLFRGTDGSNPVPSSREVSLLPEFAFLDPAEGAGRIVPVDEPSGDRRVRN